MAKRKKPIFSATRTMDRMRKLGWSMVAKVERNVPVINIKQDLWGCFDIIALDPAGIWVMAQACSKKDKASHLDKLSGLGCQHAIKTWCNSPDHRAELWWWRPLKLKRGGKAIRWTVERTDLLTGLVIGDPAEPCESDAFGRGEAGLFGE